MQHEPDLVSQHNSYFCSASLYCRCTATVSAVPLEPQLSWLPGPWGVVKEASLGKLETGLRRWEDRISKRLEILQKENRQVEEPEKTQDKCMLFCCKWLLKSRKNIYKYLNFIADKKHGGQVFKQSLMLYVVLAFKVLLTP